MDLMKRRGMMLSAPHLERAFGSIASFNTNYPYKLKGLTVNIEPVQAGSGDPSPDNVRPISGRTSATVTRTGKNLLNSGFCLNRTLRGLKTVVNADGSITLTGTAEAATRYWNSANTLGLTLAAGTYTLSPSNLRLEKSGATMTGTFTLSEEATFSNVYWSGFTSGEVVNTVVYPQLELGSTATAYEPYAGNTYTINIGDTVYGGSLDVTGGKMVVDRTIVTLDGINKKFGYKYPDREVYQHTLAVQAKDVSPGELSKTLCDKLPTKTDNQVQAGSSNGISVRTTSTGTAIKACIVSENLGSLASANEWLTSNPLQVCYELATPLEITLTPTQIETLIGTNNIWSSCGNVDVTFYKT